MSGMYPNTKTVNFFVGCRYDCIYCEKSFKRQLKRVAGILNCPDCYSYKPHYHPERLKTSKIPSTPIVFVDGTGDIFFCKYSYMRKTFAVIDKHRPRMEKTYYFQSKNPTCFDNYLDWFKKNQDKVILLTTLETNRDGTSLEWFLQVKHRATLKLIENLISQNPNLTKNQKCRLQILINKKNIVAHLNIEKSRGYFIETGITAIEKNHVNILENIIKNTKTMKVLKNEIRNPVETGIWNKSVQEERNLGRSEGKKQKLIMRKKSWKKETITQIKGGNLLKSEKVDVRNAVSQILEPLKFTTLKIEKVKKILCNLQTGENYGFCVQTAIKLFTLLEKNLNSKGYREISQAPLPTTRFQAFYNLDYPRKVLTIEPILDFDITLFFWMVLKLHKQGTLEYVWLGYDSKGCGLPEPSIEKVQKLVDMLQSYGIEIRGKSLRGVRLN